MASPVKVRTVMARGFRRSCPHCGLGPLFRKWFDLRPECPVCDYRYVRNAGDTWAFWLIGDRLFLGVLIAALVLLFRSSSWTLAFVLLILTVVPLIATMPHRMGLCLAADYLTRVWWGDPSDLPPPSDPVENWPE